MYYRILSADENVRADEKLVKTDTVTGTALVSRDTLPEADEALRNKFVFDSGDVSADLLFRSAFEFMESGDCACGKRRHSFHSARRSCRKKTYRT